MRSLLLFFAFVILAAQAFSQSARARALVSKMTQEEKVNLVVGMGMSIPGFAENGTGVGQITDKVVGAAGTTYAIPRLNLPNTVVADGPAGLRIEPRRKNDPNTYFATAWPVASLLASTWDTKLVERVGKAMGNEVKEYGVDVLLGPGLNIHRNPLGGRNFEYYSEDPLVSGKMAAAMVNGIQSNGVGTSVKHFAANNQESNRNTVNTIVSERALREIYLKGFAIVVKEARPWTVMSSYNYINGTYTSESRDLLTTILRKEWGFKGIVMTDWFGGTDAVAQMKAGNDLLMPGTPKQKAALTEALANGSLNTKVLDENAARIVDYILISPSYNRYPFSNKPDLKAHASLAREAASDGMILLKNQSGTLPLTGSIKNVAAFGITSYDFVSGGRGSGDVNEEYTISLVQGLNDAALKVDPELNSIYTEYITAEKAKQPKKNFFEEFMNPTPRVPEIALNPALLAAAAERDDIAIITLGRNAGEGSDRKVENDFNLNASEKQLIETVAAAFHAKNKKLVVIINAGGVIETASWRDQPDAILMAWQPGLEAGNAVADVLTGKVNPSGKLATTFPVKYEDVLSAKSFPGREFPEKAVQGPMGKMMPAEVEYEEGIYVGYRGFSTFGVKPAYPFGFGMSYTNFQYGDLKINDKTMNGKITGSITITNSGSVAGKEVVQVYISAPAGKLDKPALELKSFAKTELLLPGQTQTIHFSLMPSDLASFHPDRSAWIAEPGTYTIKVGASSEDIRRTAGFILPKEMVTEKVNKVLVPQVHINELKPGYKTF